MIVSWIWLALALLFLVGFLCIRFRPLMSLSLGALTASLAGWSHLSLWITPLIFVLTSLAMEWVLRGLFRSMRRERDDSRVTGLVGRTGKLRDVVDASRGLFLLHCEGADWIAMAEPTGAIALGDEVDVVGVSGKRAVVRRLSATR